MAVDCEDPSDSRLICPKHKIVSWMEDSVRNLSRPGEVVAEIFLEKSILKQ